MSALLRAHVCAFASPCVPLHARACPPQGHVCVARTRFRVYATGELINKSTSFVGIISRFLLFCTLSASLFMPCHVFISRLNVPIKNYRVTYGAQDIYLGDLEILYSLDNLYDRDRCVGLCY